MNASAWTRNPSLSSPMTAREPWRRARLFRLGRLKAAVPAARSSARRVATLLGEWRRRAQGRRQLMKLDERMLRDIGLSRADACQEHGKWFWRE